jgi:molecular chaperone GrpE
VTDRPHDDARDDREDREAQEREAQERQGPVVRDKRRIDPTTGALREPARPSQGEPAPAAPWADPVPDSPADGLGAEVVDELTRQLAERTADLQRLQADYANYRRRVDRDRGVSRDTAVANVLTNLLPVLDDIGRARDHGELEGGFKSVAEALESVVEKLGLTRFGAAGEAFDPTVHEALTHTTSPEVTETTAVEVFQPGYRIGDRIVRPARVAVADPE